MTDPIQPRPDMIGGVPTPPLAVLPRPERLFRMRAERFEFLAQTATLAPYLTFLAALCRVQAGLAAALPAVVYTVPMRKPTTYSQPMVSQPMAQASGANTTPRMRSMVSGAPFTAGSTDSSPLPMATKAGR